MSVFLTEIIFTFVFVLTILVIKTDSSAPTSDGGIGAFTVAITLYTCILNGGAVSGACYNPAVGLSVIIMFTIRVDSSTMKYLWLYLAGPAIGGAVAGFFFKYIIRKFIFDAPIKDGVIEVGPTPKQNLDDTQNLKIEDLTNREDEPSVGFRPQ